MANEQHLDILKQGVETWNQWRGKNIENPDISEANLSGIIKDGTTNRLEPFMKGERTNLSGINFASVNLHNTGLEFVDLISANLVGADLSRTNLRHTNLSKANLSNADLYEADLYGSNLSGANLSNVRLVRARLVGVNLEDAILENCMIYGISAWDVKVNERTNQKNLMITDPAVTESPITIDNIEIAQFVHLILINEKIRDMINTISTKGVLILGRFSPPERKAVLEAIKEKLRQLDYVPILFDFNRPIHRDFTETILILAGMCNFIIADITNPKSSPLELQATVPNFMIPFVPIIQEGEKPFAMFENLVTKYNWVLDEPLEYDSVPILMEAFEKAVLEPALVMHNQIMVKKAKKLHTRHARDYVKTSE